MPFEKVQDGSHGGHIESKQSDFTISESPCCLMSHLKFKLDLTHGSGDVQNMKMTDRPYHKLT